MQMIRSILSCIIALHLLIAMSGIPLSYTFCGEDVYSWTFALPNTINQNIAFCEDSCCEEHEECRTINGCRTELHSAQLSLNMLEPSFVLASQITPIVTYYSSIFSNNTSYIASISISSQFFLNKPPSYRLDRTVSFRVFLI